MGLTLKLPKTLRNCDGKITMEEAPEELKTGFDYIDTNGDGEIDRQEVQLMADYANQGSAVQAAPASGSVRAFFGTLMDPNAYIRVYHYYCSVAYFQWRVEALPMEISRQWAWACCFTVWYLVGRRASGDVSTWILLVETSR